jgi:hypothetical protein
MSHQAEVAGREHLWRGPVTSERTARRIIIWTGWAVIALALPVIYNVVSDLMAGDHTRIVGSAVALLIFEVPAALLLRFGSRVAAVVLLVITSLLSLLLITVTSVAAVLVAQGKFADPRSALVLPAVALMWVVLAFMSLRAVRATTALRRVLQVQ